MQHTTIILTPDEYFFIRKTGGVGQYWRHKINKNNGIEGESTLNSSNDRFRFRIQPIRR